MDLTPGAAAPRQSDSTSIGAESATGSRLPRGGGRSGRDGRGARKNSATDWDEPETSWNFSRSAEAKRSIARRGFGESFDAGRQRANRRDARKSRQRPSPEPRAVLNSIDEVRVDQVCCTRRLRDSGDPGHPDSSSDGSACSPTRRRHVGRYSLDEPGHPRRSGRTLQDYIAEVPSPGPSPGCGQRHPDRGRRLVRGRHRPAIPSVPACGVR